MKSNSTSYQKLQNENVTSKITVKFLNFRRQKFCCNLPKIQTKRPNFRVFCQKDTNGIANSEDPHETAPLPTHKLVNTSFQVTMMASVFLFSQMIIVAFCCEYCEIKIDKILFLHLKF